MQYRLSRNTALAAADPQAAAHFYGDVLGLTTERSEHGQTVQGDGFQMFIDDDSICSGFLMELVVDDVEAAREHLEANGCRVLDWRGAGKACIIEDPHGLRFNIWQDT